MNLNISFRNAAQETFFWSKTRNSCFSGGFGNGKSYIGCLRQVVHLLTFPGYRSLIARQYYKDLKETTMKTFFKICPEQFVKKHSEIEGLTVLSNGSTILWKHLDDFDEQSLRGLEINAALIDQAEEISESIYLILDSRIGRWDKVTVSSEYLDTNPHWPRNPFGEPRVHNFLDILCNPDTTYHWIYRRYHPDSVERMFNHFFINAPTDESMNDPATIEQMKSRDPEWVQKYFYGTWGTSTSQIHSLRETSIIEMNDDLLDRIKNQAALYRILDHGDSGITCCLWAAALDGVYIFYREYYSSNELISNHRVNITALSEGEYYMGSYADPSIFHKASQRDGGFWTVADEYLTADLNSPSLFWTPADNNEFATRNRINELLKPSFRFKHPITKESPAPGIYFVKKTKDYPNGCYYAQNQLGAQRRLQIGSDNGRAIYSDDRDEKVPDHAYDPVRYFISMHGGGKPEQYRRPPKRSFAFFNYLNNRKMQPTPLGRVI